MVSADERLPRSQIPFQFKNEGWMKRHPSGTPLELGNEQDAATKINVADAEAQCFAES
jgi:hypothetical protein